MDMTRSSSDALLKALGQLHPKSIDLSLGRIERLLTALGHPERALPPVIHLAGTNGKGSTVAFLRAILEAGGHCVHSYTSPHLRSFHERIALGAPSGGAPISEPRLVDILKRAEAANAGQEITFFEIVTAAAFLAFAETPGDFLILETGLGGRLDATNMVERPALTAITPIGLDHAEYLGNDLATIAGEKAGILKRGVPCVAAPQAPEALSVLETRADELDVPLMVGGRDWDAYEQHGRLVFQDHSALLDLARPRLAGRHQIVNAGLAIAAARQLEGVDMAARDLEIAIAGAVWPARLESLSLRMHEGLAQPPEVWLDGGHNPMAGRALATAMADMEEHVSRPLHVICAIMSTKDASGFLQPFQGLAELVVAIPIPGSERALDPEQLALSARQLGFPTEIRDSLADALELSRANTPRGARVLICGSLELAKHAYDLARVDPLGNSV